MNKIWAHFHGCLLLMFCCEWEDVHANLLYKNISDPRALCNDFTRAGLFKQTFPASTKWIIFFESGGFCYSADSCNQRFFHPSLRQNSAFDDEIADEHFDAAAVWKEHKNQDLSYVVSPLMTSVYRFRNRKDLFPQGGLIVDGTDILSRNCDENPLFCEYNFVVVPYCSSDLWLGNDSRDFGGESEEYFYSHHYQPDSNSLQFLFRGAVIFRAAIADLLPLFGDTAEEIVLAGSSAGGVGVLNHVLWMKDYLSANSVPASLSVIVDSSWFIDFQGDLEKLFGTDTSDSPSDASSTTSTVRETLLDIISWHKPCNDMKYSGFPCCIAAHCILSNPNYYPNDIPTFAIISLYDVFILGASVRGLATLASEKQALEPGYALDFVRTIAEYGGEMNQSITELNQEVNFVSTFVTGCFQHIYLATTTLWGEPGMSLFGRSLVEFGSSLAAIRHSIQPTVWSSFRLNQSSGRSISIKEAIEIWFPTKTNRTFHFRDNCQGPHCNNACPEMFVLDELVSNLWKESGKVIMIMIAVGVAVVCVVMKIVFTFWLWKLEWKQQLYLGLLGDESSTSDIETALQFPDCSESDAVSISCLDLSYKIKISQQIKDERKDNVTPLVLGELSTTEEDLEISNRLDDKDKYESDEWMSFSGDSELSQRRRLERKPTKQELLQRVRTRRTLRETYRGYHGGPGGNATVNYNKPEAIRRLQSFARRTLRGSRRLSQQQSSFFDDDVSLTAEVISLNITKSPEPLMPDDINSSSRNYYDSQDSQYGEPLHNEKIEEEQTGKLNNHHSSEVPSTAKKRADLSVNLKGLLSQQRTSLSIKYGARKYKEILKGISLYFNPGELIGIMGPSGCGKTTFLDLLTGRRNTGTIKGHIYINGTKMDEVRDWYISSTGYVLQLANPYYEELTVRENLTLAAQIKLSNHYTLREKFQRVEQVMFVSGLLEFAETRVGGSTGPGLSGGQKRRLAVALQLLKLPNVIFLDEPTSGLDAASSFELLTHLNKLADSNRTIILTIHQPRLEIFHMFTRLVLLCDGKVAYHGVPDKAYEVFVNALKSRYLEQGLSIPELEDHNPADVIMDILGNSSMRQIITDYYQASDEPKYVRQAINAAVVNESKRSGSITRNTFTRQFSFAMYGARKVQHKHAGTFSRLAALEARASRRRTWPQSLYLPVIFFAYGILLGTAYFQQSAPLLVMSGFCVYSVASALFMFPILFNYYSRALQMYTYEHGDGVGNAFDLIVQGFIHALSMSVIPVILCAGILYLLLVNTASYDGLIFGQVVVVNIVLNQCWTSLLIALICTFPVRAFRLSPVISSVAGFTSGFFIPIHQMHWGYRWIFYINPNYYGFSASAYLLLANFKTTCVGSKFECYTASGEYILRQFSFHDVNPYLHVLILLLFTALFLMLAVFSHWLRHSNITSDIVRVKLLIRPNFWQTSIPSTPEPVVNEDVEDISADEEAEKIDERFILDEDPQPEQNIQSSLPVNPGDLVVENQATLRDYHQSKEKGLDQATEEVNLSTIVEERASGSIESNEDPEKSDVTSGEERPRIDIRGCSLSKLTKCSSDSRIKENRIEITPVMGEMQGFGADQQDILMSSMGSSRSMSGMIRTKPSAFLNHGERHRVWRPCPLAPTQQAYKRPISKLQPQRSKLQLLADRKKLLDSRLLATREVLKMKNIEDAQITAAATKPSFSDVSHQVKSNISTRRKSMEHFHTIVDKYVAMMANPEKTITASPMSPAVHGEGALESPSGINASGKPQSGGRSYHPLQFKQTFSPQSTPSTPSLSASMNWSQHNVMKPAVSLSSSSRRRETPVKHPMEKKITTMQILDKYTPYTQKSGLHRSEAPVLRVQSAGAICTVPEKKASIDAGAASLPL